MIFEFNHKVFSHSRQSPVCGIKKRVRSEVISRLKLFSFEHPPKYLGNVKMRRIRWKEEQVQSSSLPQLAQGEQFLCPMYRCVVKHDDGLTFNGHGEVVQTANHRLCINALFCCEPMGSAMTVNHSEAVEPFATLRGNVNIFLGKFPAVWHIGFLAKMGLVSIIKVNRPVLPQSFKLLQLPKFIVVELRRGFPLRTFLYTSKSCANALKKRLSVSSQAVFPVAASHCALAANTLERSFSMARRIISSSCVPMMGLRPQSERVSNPLIPSDSKRFTQLLTDAWFISNCRPIWGELKPCAFSSTALHRIRKACDAPLRYPFSNAVSCIGVNSGVLILPIRRKVSFITITEKRIKHYHINYILWINLC